MQKKKSRYFVHLAYALSLMNKYAIIQKITSYAMYAFLP